jgi:macrolide transport system ATP-binding/permease protein
VGAGRTVILSYAAWQKRFSGKQDVLGRTLTLNGAPTTIVGVLPRGFQFALYGADFWGNLRGSDICEQSRGCRNLYMVARLNDGVSIERAAARMRSIAVRLRKQYPGANRDLGSVALVPLRDVIVGDVRPVLLVLLAGAALLLLIACVNVSTLLLARSDKRRREFAVRGALGASSSRLFRQFAMEGLALAALGCCLGLLSAHWGMRFLSGIVPPDEMDSMPYLRGLGLNLFTAAAGCGILLMAGVLFSVIPIMRTFAAEAMEGLKEGARGSAGTTWRRFGSNLVIAEVAIAMVLMAGAGLLGKSLYLLLHVDLGFTPERLVQLQTSWKPADYTTDRQKIVLAGELMRRISSLPGVASVALSTAPPVDSAWGTASFHVAGRANRGEANEALQRQVSSTYFATLQARLLRGRYFREDEDASKPSVVVINRALSNKYFPGEDPVGIQLYYDGQPQSPMRVVGVVEDIKEGSLEAGNMAAMYVPFNQKPVAWPAILVRASSREAPLLPRIVQATHGVDPFITVSQGETMTQRINQSPSAYLHRSAAVLVGVFAGSALLLSVVGLYGVVAYSVSQRTREIGVRMALGAGRESVHRMIMREAARLTGFGIVLGLAGSLGGAILLRTLLFDVRSWDVPTLTAVVAVLGVSTLAASYVPARRAAAVNPVEALRAE